MGIHLWRWLAAPMALALSGQALAETQIAVSLAGEACEGTPAFQISAHGKALAEGVVSKALDTRSEGRLYANPSPEAYVQTFVYSIDDADFPADAAVRLTLTNDHWDPSSGCDRNLFVASVSVNGEVRKGADLQLFEGSQPQHPVFQAGMLPLYDAAQAIEVTPPATGWPDFNQQAAAATPDVAAPSTQLDAN